MPGNDTDSDSPLEPVAQEMIESSSISPLNPSRHYSGDGTWTEAHVICCVVDARDKAIALAKAGAAFSNREGRPDPLFSHDKSETFELVIELKSLPLAVAETDWDKYEPIAQLGTEDADDAMKKAIAESQFDRGDSIIYNEWGDKLSSQAELHSHIQSLDEGWFVLGIGLQPTGSGTAHEQYLGNTYDIRCPECGHVGAECVNIVFEDRADSHVGVWDCGGCGTDYRGPHPEGAADLGTYQS